MEDNGNEIEVLHKRIQYLEDKLNEIRTCTSIGLYATEGAGDLWDVICEISYIASKIEPMETIA